MDVLVDKRPVSWERSAPLFRGQSIYVAVDSSKTNTAIAVLNRAYKPICLIELNGSKEHDVLKLIQDQRKYLGLVFEGCTVLGGGIEDIITKREEENGRYSEGLKHHHARYVITAVFVSIICFFQDKFNLTLELVSNQAWKAAVLPKELNRRGVYKGSVDYIKEKYPKYVTGGKDDDGTDAICIGEYLKLRSGLADGSMEDISDDDEFSRYQFKMKFWSPHSKVNESVGVRFLYNPNKTLESNAVSIANHIEYGQLGYTMVPIGHVTLESLYQNFGGGTFDEVTKEIMLVVKRM